MVTVYQVPPPCFTGKGASVASALGRRTAFKLPGVHKLISKPYCFYSNSSKKKAVLFVDEKLSSFFLNVGDKLHVDSNLSTSPENELKSKHSKCREVGSQTSFPEASCPFVNTRERDFIDTLYFLMGFVS